MCLYLPRYLGDAERRGATSAAQARPRRARDGESVLLIEDEATVRMLVAEVLEEPGLPGRSRRRTARPG